MDLMQLQEELRKVLMDLMEVPGEPSQVTMDPREVQGEFRRVSTKDQATLGRPPRDQRDRVYLILPSPP